MFGTSGIVRYATEKQQTEPGWQNLPLDEVMARCGPLWDGLGEEEKSRYNKKRKNKKKTSELKVDSFNRNLEDIEREIELSRADPDIMRAKIRRGYGDVEDIRDVIFTVIHTNIFVKTDSGKIVPAEICVANFSLKKGIIEIYHEFPAAGDIPQGYRYDCTAWADVSHKIPLDLAYANPNYHSIMKNIENLVFNNKTQDGKVDELLFTIGRERKQTKELLDFLQSATVNKTNRVCDGGQEKFTGQVLDLAYLYQYIHYYQVENSELIPGLNMTTFVQTLEDRLMSSKFMWHNIACNFHDTDSTYCSQALVKNWIYNMCFELCPLMSIEMLPGYHQPSTVLRIENFGEEEDFNDEVTSQSEVSSVFSDYRQNSDIRYDDSDNSDASLDLRIDLRERLEQIKRKQHNQDYKNVGELAALEYKHSEASTCSDSEGTVKSRLDIVKQKIRQKKSNKPGSKEVAMTEMTAKRTRMMRTFSSCSSISDNNNWYETADSSFSDTNSCFDDEERVGAAGDSMLAAMLDAKFKPGKKAGSRGGSDKNTN